MKSSKLVYFFLPMLAALLTNKKLSIKQANKEKQLEKDRANWKNMITNENESPFGKMADDLYNFEIQRLNILARKGTSILAATGFVIALMSLTLTLKRDWITNSNVFSLIGLCFIILAVFYFVTSAASASEALRISQFHQLTIGDSEQIITKKMVIQAYKNEWTIEKIHDVEINYDILLIKTNWLDAAQESFFRGIVLTAISFIFLIIAL